MNSKELLIRRGTNEEHSRFTGEIGEITLDTTNYRVVLHDGITIGGHPIAREDHKHNVDDITSLGEMAKVDDAIADTRRYVRQNGEWVEKPKPPFSEINRITNEISGIEEIVNNFETHTHEVSEIEDFGSMAAVFDVMPNIVDPDMQYVRRNNSWFEPTGGSYWKDENDRLTELENTIESWITHNHTLDDITDSGTMANVDVPPNDGMSYGRKYDDFYGYNRWAPVESFNITDLKDFYTSELEGKAGWFLTVNDDATGVHLVENVRADIMEYSLMTNGIEFVKLTGKYEDTYRALRFNYSVSTVWLDNGFRLEYQNRLFNPFTEEERDIARHSFPTTNRFYSFQSDRNGIVYPAPYELPSCIYDPFYFNSYTFYTSSVWSFHNVGMGCDGKMYYTPRGGNFTFLYDPDTEAVYFIKGDVSVTHYSTKQGPDGKLYSIHTGYVLIVDPGTQEVKSIPTPGGNHYSLTLGQDNKFYCLPNSGSNVMIIDTITQKTYNMPVVDPIGNTSYTSQTMALDGKIYGRKSAVDYSLVVDPSSQSNYVLNANDFNKEKWIDSIASKQDKIYFSPYNFEFVGVYDPKTKVLSFIESEELNKESKEVCQNKTWGIAEGPDGKFYCCPHSSRYVLIIDPNTDTTSVIDTFFPDTQKWAGIAQGPDGNMYCAPYNSEYILVIHPTTQSLSFISTLSIQTSMAAKWTDVVQGKDGLMYFIPKNSNEIMVLDTSDQSLSSWSFVSLGSGNRYFYGATVSEYNGKIYLPNWNNQYYCVIDPSTKTDYRIDVASSKTSFGAALHSDGKIYCTPFNSNQIVTISSINDDREYIDIGQTSSWNGMAIDSLGKMYCAPFNSDNILTIDLNRTDQLRVVHRTKAFKNEYAHDAINVLHEKPVYSNYPHYAGEFRDESDEFWDETILYISAENQSLTTPNIRDTSKEDNTVYMKGSIEVSSNESIFGGKSLYFNGSSRLEIPCGDLFRFPEEFTIEMWYFLPAGAPAPFLMNLNNYTDGMRIVKGGYGIHVNGSSSLYTDYGQRDVWVHFAICRDASGKIRWFEDGTEYFNYTITSTIVSNYTSNSQLLTIGGDTGGGYPFTGYLDEIRITKGVARYTEDFTPQTERFFVRPVVDRLPRDITDGDLSLGWSPSLGEKNNVKFYIDLKESLPIKNLNIHYDVNNNDLYRYTQETKFVREGRDIKKIVHKDLIKNKLLPANTLCDRIDYTANSIYTECNKDISILEDFHGVVRNFSSYAENNLVLFSGTEEESLSKYNTKSIKFDGVEGYVSVDNIDSLKFYKVDFTVEMWIRPDSSSGTRVLLDTRPLGFLFYIDGRKLTFSCNGTVIAGGDIAPPGEWYHVALVRKRDEIRLFVNGIRVADGTFSDSIDNINNFLIGKSMNESSFYKGFIDEINITRTAKYNGNFPPPTSFRQCVTWGHGGNLTYELHGYRIHVFEATEKFRCLSAGEMDIFLVGGGGGGGCAAGASGGGGGGVVFRTNLFVDVGEYTIIVGAGGARSINIGNGSGMPNASRGGDSEAFGLTALGGGFGASYYDGRSRDGGCGGGSSNYFGAAGQALQTIQIGDSGKYGFGNDGAMHSLSYTYPQLPYYNPGGGGGGAGFDAIDPADIIKTGDGGTGKYFGDIFGEQIGDNGWFAGGGGGGDHGNDLDVIPIENIGKGGIGGGGKGDGPMNNYTGESIQRGIGIPKGYPGDSNTGGGGGGAGRHGGYPSEGGNGGSGIVIIRYKV